MAFSCVLVWCALRCFDLCVVCVIELIIRPRAGCCLLCYARMWCEPVVCYVGLICDVWLSADACVMCVR